MNDVMDIINFTIWDLQRCITNHKKYFKNAFNKLLTSTNHINYHINL